MADVTITYDGDTIAEMSASGSKTLLTSGKYCDDDIEVTYVKSGGGGGTLGTKTITANGEYDATDDELDGYSEVTVSVPNTYTQSDEGKVVSNGALVAQTAHSDVTPTTSDQTIDTTLNNSLKVKGDANLVAGNIKKDVVIFNTTGSYEGSGSSVTVDDVVLKRFPSGAITLSEATTLDQYSGLYNNKAITKASSNSITTIGQYTFRYCENLEEIDFPNLTRIGQASFGSPDAYIFANCPKLVKFNLPKLASINGQYAFANCGTASNKALIALPAIVNMSARTFRDGYFSAVDLGASLSTDSSRGIRDQTFYNGSYGVVILRPNAVVPVTNADAIRKLTTDNGCTIYVPQSLISSYESATIWSSATRTYVAIEGSYYETHYADGTVIS